MSLLYSHITTYISIKLKSITIVCTNYKSNYEARYTSKLRKNKVKSFLYLNRKPKSVVKTITVMETVDQVDTAPFAARKYVGEVA